MRQFPLKDFDKPYIGTSVALVDDDSLLRDTLARLLEMTGMTVEQYDSGEDFLAAAASSGVACAVLDIQLGDLSGIAVAHRLKESDPHFPIVFITGSIDPVFEEQADEIEGAAFLRKPFLRDTLIEAIMAAMATRRNPERDSAHRTGADDLR